jgi:hypothetical protein
MGWELIGVVVWVECGFAAGLKKEAAGADQSRVSMHFHW